MEFLPLTEFKCVHKRRVVSPETCRAENKDPNKNRVCVLQRCPSSFRYCRACIRDGTVHPLESRVVSPASFLCRFHTDMGAEQIRSGRNTTGVPVENAMEDARRVYSLLVENDLNVAAVARRLCQSRGWVSLRIRLLQLEPQIQELVEKGILVFSTAGVLCHYRDVEFQFAMVHDIFEERLDYLHAKAHIEEQARIRGIELPKRAKDVRCSSEVLYV